MEFSAKNTTVLISLAVVGGLGLFALIEKETLIKYKTEEKHLLSEGVSNPFANISLEAKSALVYDIKEQRSIFEYNAEMQLPLASLTKVMTAIAIRELLRPDQKIIAPESIAKGGSNLPHEWKLEDIFKITLVESSNEGALVLGNTLNDILGGKRDESIQIMNKVAERLSMFQTFFINETGLDADMFVAGGYGSLFDMEKLFSYGLSKYPDLFESTNEATSTIESNGNLYTLKNTNEAIDKLPGLVASKTGFTDLAGGNLIVVIDIGPNHPIFIGILGSSKDGRFIDVEALAEKTLEYFALH
jgi:D-alanyl-D-alanine carboxypeptidase